MVVNKTRIMVVGGGATGVGIIRDLALRGIDAVLVEQQDLAHGASFRFHGLLHSGARYAVKDPSAAKECITENLILKKIAPTCVKESGGLFLQHKNDEDKYVEEWLTACQQAGIPFKELSIQEIRRGNPYLTKDLKKGYLVPDAIIDGPRLVWANVHQAIKYGAKVLTYTKLTGLKIENGKVVGAEVINTLTREKSYWECDYIINAAGTWADEVAKLGGMELKITKNKGSLLVFNLRLTPKVLNRLRPPDDGDIIVPHHTVTILGTTSINVDQPDSAKPTSEEVEILLKAGKELLPNIDQYRLLRAYAGVRPLYAGNSDSGEDGRNISRDFVILDHKLEGLKGFISLVGGKLTTYRLIAEKTVDYLCKEMGIKRLCTTAQVPLVDPALTEEKKGKINPWIFRYGEEGTKIEQYLEKHPEKNIILCECEDVSFAEVEEVASWESTNNLDDLRRKTRIGMGTCQGLYCSFRSLGTAWESLKKKPEHPLHQLGNFLERRFKGQRTLLWESQIKESELTLGVYSTIFNLERVEVTDEI
ncbi:MAG TPA: anaerobic glycerol-3-phosphate dehydrogenase subunit A [Peptococcaceae bacterium]|nr:anaerobic glycerol-3-phosphate dehydrogenase subunit A [Peptococcaceae bacterium]